MRGFLFVSIYFLCLVSAKVSTSIPVKVQEEVNSGNVKCSKVCGVVSRQVVRALAHYHVEYRLE